MHMKNKLLIKWAAILLILHGFTEIMGLFALFAPAQYVSKLFVNFGGMSPSVLQENVVLISIFGLLWGITRIIAAIGIIKNRKWAMALGIIISSITLIASVSIIPFGIMDSLYAIPVLILLLIMWFGKTEI
jgi:hypothetical protein